MRVQKTSCFFSEIVFFRIVTAVLAGALSCGTVLVQPCWIGQEEEARTTPDPPDSGMYTHEANYPDVYKNPRDSCEAKERDTVLSCV